MEEEKQKEFRPDPAIFTCPFCKDIFQRPVTLACGHTFCLYCLAPEETREDSPLVPVCPSCREIIWRPPSQLRENVVMANLMSRYHFSRKTDHPPLPPTLPGNRQHQILIECQETATIPMPHCASKIVFTTAFMDEIIQQQSQTNPIILRWPQAPPKMGIAGRISRPEIYHYALRLRPHETSFRAQFQGLYYVELQSEHTISVCPHPTLDSNDINEASLTLCLSTEIKAANTLPIETFELFFQVYDQLNNPIYLRQIAQMIEERILNERIDPQAMIYCVMKVLRFPDKQLKALVETMDDLQRWRSIEEYLLKNAGKPAMQVIRVDIPGNYPHELLFILLFLLVILYYFTQ